MTTDRILGLPVQDPGADVAGPAVRAVVPAPPGSRRRSRPLVLSKGVGPYLLALDLLAWTVAVLAVGRPDLPHVALAGVMVVLLASAGAYRSRLSLYALEDGLRVIGRILMSGAVVVSVLLVTGRDRGLVDVLQTSVLVAGVAFLLRAGGYALVRQARARGIVTHRTLVVGAGQIGVQIVQLLQEHPEYGLRPVGFLDRAPLLREHELPVPLLGGPDALAATIEDGGVDEVIVAFGSMPGHELVALIRTCDRLECGIFFVPRLFELHATARDVDAVRGMPLIRHSRAAFHSPSWRLKRLADVLVSALALLVLLPVLLACGLAIRLESGPGILFRQVRVGMDGRPFELLKLRSLRPADDDESATRWNVAHDDRLGPVGRVLRRTSLDELPQLWNILRGDMSLVGPRPERPHFVESFANSTPRYLARHRVPSGLTGWSQVHGLRGDTSIAERARFDNFYIENWSLLLDLRIVLMTVLSVVRRTGG